MPRPWFLRSGSAFADRFAALVADSVRKSLPVRVTGSVLGEVRRLVTGVPGYGLAVFVVKAGLVAGFGYHAWDYPFLGRLRYGGPGWWYFEFALWAYLVSVVALAVVLPGFVVMRVLRAGWMGVFLAAGPMAVLAAVLHFGYGFDVWRVQSWAWLEAGWSRGGSVGWVPVGAFAGCHVLWTVLVVLALRRESAFWWRVRPWFFVPFWLALRLAVPVGVTWAVVDYSLGGPSGVLDWTEYRIETLLGQYPEVARLVAEGVISRTWLVYAGGALSVVGLVAVGWYFCDLVAILLAYQLEVVASLQRSAAAVRTGDGGEGSDPRSARLHAVRDRGRARGRARLAEDAKRAALLREELERLTAAGSDLAVARAELDAEVPEAEVSEVPEAKAPGGGGTGDAGDGEGGLAGWRRRRRRRVTGRVRWGLRRRVRWLLNSGPVRPVAWCVAAPVSR